MPLMKKIFFQDSVVYFKPCNLANMLNLCVQIMSKRSQFYEFNAHERNNKVVNTSGKLGNLSNLYEYGRVSEKPGEIPQQ